MPSVLAVSGSPSSPSFTHEVLASACRALRASGHRVDTLVLRDLPARALLRADTTDPALAEGLRRLAGADGVLVATPVHKAAYSGLLKCFLDAAPQYGLRGKTVLPLATGGSTAHALALDYGLRPVLASMRPAAITDAVFVPAGAAQRADDGARVPDPATRARLEEALEQFQALLGAAPALPAAPTAPAAGVRVAA